MSEDQKPADPAVAPDVSSWREKLLAERPNLHEFLPFLDELNRESDRGAILISCSYLDELLRRAIEAYLADGRAAKKLLSDFNAPLGTFSSRIAAALALSLIDKDEHDSIERLRKVRNEFAHSVTAKFGDPKIDSLCASFQLHLSDGTTPQLSAKQRFIMTAVAMITRLVNRAHYVGLKKLQPRSWPN